MALPGVKTAILDRRYNEARTDLPGGPLVAIIAKRSTASSALAPDMVGFYATSEQDVIAQFGDGSPIHRGYYEVTTGGASNVVLVALPANTVFDQANGTLTSAGNVAVFDEVFSAVEAARADIVVAWGRGSNATDWDDFATPATPGNTEYGFYADNSTVLAKSWAKLIADKCAEITANSYPITAVIGVKPIAGTDTALTSQIAAGLALPNLTSNQVFSTGNFINVVATEVKPLSYEESWGWSNGAGLYAAIIARLDAWSATTGKPLYNVSKLRYNPTRTQALALVNKGVVPVQLDFQRVARWVDGTTFAPSASDYVRLSTLRIIFDAVKIVRGISQKYIGEGMSTAQKNAFETQISSSLRGMHQLGAVNHSDFRVQYSPSTNTAIVDLAIVPAFELREVYVNVSVNF